MNKKTQRSENAQSKSPYYVLEKEREREARDRRKKTKGIRHSTAAARARGNPTMVGAANGRGAARQGAGGKGTD